MGHFHLERRKPVNNEGEGSREEDKNTSDD